MTISTNAGAKPPVRHREIFGWAMYDFANSSYTTVIITFVYSAFFVAYIVPPELSHMSGTFWSIGIAVSTGIAMVLAPLVGILCDYSGRKKRYLAWCTWASVLGTGGLYFVDPGNVWLGITFLVCSNTAWMLSESFIASFLTDLATKETMGRISGIGWGIGYIGGLASLLLTLAVIGSNYGDVVDRNQLAMLCVAAFYALGALPTFLFVEERAEPDPTFENAAMGTLVKASFQRLIAMKQIISSYPVLFQFFLCFMVYTAGVSAIIKFFGIYAQEEIGIGGSDIVKIGATLQVAAMLGAVVFGFVEDRFGSKNTLLITLVWWLAGLTGIYFIEPLQAWSSMDMVNLFVVISFVAGSAMGATLSASRAVVGLLAKPEDSALLFGLWGTFGRFAIILGMTFGPISDVVGRHQGLLVIMVYFVIGGLMLWRVPLSEAIQEQRTAAAAPA